MKVFEEPIFEVIRIESEAVTAQGGMEVNPSAEMGV